MLRFPLSALLFLLSAVNVYCNVITHPHQLERRNMLTDCTSRLALDTWKLDRPSNASAAICFHGKYDLTSWDADHYKPRVKTACTVRNWLKYKGWGKKQ